MSTFRRKLLSLGGESYDHPLYTWYKYIECVSNGWGTGYAYSYVTASGWPGYSGNGGNGPWGSYNGLENARARQYHYVFTPVLHDVSPTTAQSSFMLMHGTQLATNGTFGFLGCYNTVARNNATGHAYFGPMYALAGSYQLRDQGAHWTYTDNSYRDNIFEVEIKHGRAATSHSWDGYEYDTLIENKNYNRVILTNLTTGVKKYADITAAASQVQITSASNNVPIFTGQTSGNNYCYPSRAGWRIYSIAIYVDVDETIPYYAIIPAVRKSDNRAGIYNPVTNVFYPGTGRSNNASYYPIVGGGENPNLEGIRDDIKTLVAQRVREAN